MNHRGDAHQNEPPGRNNMYRNVQTPTRPARQFPYAPQAQDQTFVMPQLTAQNLQASQAAQIQSMSMQRGFSLPGQSIFNTPHYTYSTGGNTLPQNGYPSAVSDYVLNPSYASMNNHAYGSGMGYGTQQYSQFGYGMETPVNPQSQGFAIPSQDFEGFKGRGNVPYTPERQSSTNSFAVKTQVQTPAGSVKSFGSQQTPDRNTARTAFYTPRVYGSLLITPQPRALKLESPYLAAAHVRDRLATPLNFANNYYFADTPLALADTPNNDHPSDSDYAETPVKPKKKATKPRGKAVPAKPKEPKPKVTKAKTTKASAGRGKKDTTTAATVITKRKNAAYRVDGYGAAPDAKKQKLTKAGPDANPFELNPNAAPFDPKVTKTPGVDANGNWEYDPDQEDPVPCLTTLDKDDDSDYNDCNDSTPVKGSSSSQKQRKPRAPRGKLMRWNERDRIMMLLGLVSACGPEIELPFEKAAKLIGEINGIRCSRVAFQQSLIKVRDRFKGEVMEELEVQTIEELPEAYREILKLSMNWPQKERKGGRTTDVVVKNEKEEGKDKSDKQESGMDAAGKEGEADEGGTDAAGKKEEAQKNGAQVQIARKAAESKTVYVDRIVEVEKIVEKIIEKPVQMSRPQYVDAEAQVCIDLTDEPRIKNEPVSQETAVDIAAFANGISHFTDPSIYQTQASAPYVPQPSFTNMDNSYPAFPTHPDPMRPFTNLSGSLTASPGFANRRRGNNGMAIGVDGIQNGGFGMSGMGGEGGAGIQEGGMEMSQGFGHFPKEFTDYFDCDFGNGGNGN